MGMRRRDNVEPKKKEKKMNIRGCDGRVTYHACSERLCPAGERVLDLPSGFRPLTTAAISFSAAAVSQKDGTGLWTVHDQLLGKTKVLWIHRWFWPFTDTA